jgi:hypothetical protein
MTGRLHVTNDLENALQQLVEVVAVQNTVRAIGLSGGDRALPEPGEGDIDLFIYCSAIPASQQRRELLNSHPNLIQNSETDLMENGHWGQADRVGLRGVETWMMYFTVAEAGSELAAILAGKFLGREDSEFYPIGRCALLKGMRLLYDPDGVLQSFQHRLAEYPQELALKVINHHLKALQDVEDLQRAVQRKDVLFFHYVLDLALDHFLLAMFALNREYFPSRKRSQGFIHKFSVKPADCEDRLCQLVRLGGQADTLDQSYWILGDLVRDLTTLIENGRTNPAK